MGMLKKQEQIRKLPFNSLGPQIELKVPRFLVFDQTELQEISATIHEVTCDAVKSQYPISKYQIITEIPMFKP